MSVSPTASRLILAAAPMYRSISAGDVPRTSAILSRPSRESSGGRIVAGIHVDREQVADRIRVFGAIHPVQCGCARIGVRLGGTIDGVLRVWRNASNVARSGRGAPVGGIIPARSFRTTFSQISGVGFRDDRYRVVPE